jgi:uncharacterized protein YkwD
MAKHQFVSHIGSDGSNYIDRVKRLKTDIIASSEIICAGPGGKNRVNAVLDGWLNSDGHRKIMLDGRQKLMGLGYHLKTNDMPGNYWVVNFSFMSMAYTNNVDDLSIPPLRLEE